MSRVSGCALGATLCLIGSCTARPAGSGVDAGVVCDLAATDGGAPESDAGAAMPSYCVTALAGVLQDIDSTPASPYYVHHPDVSGPTTQTVVFLPGGSGSSSSAQRIWLRFVSSDPRTRNYRFVIPYSLTVDFIDEAKRTYSVLDEVLACYGGDPGRVHLAGYSNGGRAAFGLMLQQPDRFISLLGTPGVFPTVDPPTFALILGCRGRPVFNGVGELDTGWKDQVQATHAGLTEAGVDSVYVEYPGETHRLSDAFDGGVFFDFWALH